MRVEKNFNQRTAPLIEIQAATVTTPAGHALGVKVEFFPVYLQSGFGTLSAGMAPKEARELAAQLVRAADEYDAAHGNG